MVKKEMKSSLMKKIEYIEILAKRKTHLSYPPDEVMIKFVKLYKEKMDVRMHVIIGLDVAKHINLSPNDKMRVFMSKKDSRQIRLEKSKNGHGFKVNAIISSEKEIRAMEMQYKWPEKSPSKEEMSIKIVQHEISDGGINFTW